MGSLNKHIDTVHLKLRDHACPYCEGVVFGTKRSLTRHLNTVHLEQRDHACPNPTAPASPSGRRAP
jgi:hypothetical protein